MQMSNFFWVLFFTPQALRQTALQALPCSQLLPDNVTNSCSFCVTLPSTFQQLFEQWNKHTESGVRPAVHAAGRQDVLGLAISLVATVPEKVWYCSVKGYTPWEQPKAADVATRDQGGHTIWYDEPQLIQVRLAPADTTIAIYVLERTLSLSRELLPCCSLCKPARRHSWLAHSLLFPHIASLSVRTTLFGNGCGCLLAFSRQALLQLHADRACHAVWAGHCSTAEGGSAALGSRPGSAPQHRPGSGGSGRQCCSLWAATQRQRRSGVCFAKDGHLPVLGVPMALLELQHQGFIKCSFRVLENVERTACLHVW